MCVIYAKKKNHPPPPKKTPKIQRYDRSKAGLQKSPQLFSSQFTKVTVFLTENQINCLFTWWEFFIVINSTFIVLSRESFCDVVSERNSTILASQTHTQDSEDCNQKNLAGETFFFFNPEMLSSYSFLIRQFMGQWKDTATPGFFYFFLFKGRDKELGPTTDIIFQDYGIFSTTYVVFNKQKKNLIS